MNTDTVMKSPFDVITARNSLGKHFCRRGAVQHHKDAQYFSYSVKITYFDCRQTLQLKVITHKERKFSVPVI